MILDITMRDDSMVQGMRNGKPHTRAKNSIWYQRVKFKDGKRKVNEQKAIALCKKKWPEATSYSADLKESNTPAPTFEYLQEVL